MSTGPRAADDRADSPRRPDRRGPESAPAASWRWGELSGARGTLIVIAVAIVGAVVTVATKHDPGPLLGWLIVAGTVIALFAVRPRSAYLLVPVPALAYMVFGLAAGFIRDQSEPSGTALTVNAAQWIANGFLTMAAATVLAVVVALGRWLLDRRAAGRRAGDGGRGESGRSVQSDSSGLIGESDEAGFGGQRGQSGLRGPRDRGGPRDRSGPREQSGRTSWGGRGGRGDESDWPGRSEGSGRDERGGRGSGGGRDDRRGREQAEPPGRPRPAFYPNPDWSGDRGRARDPRDRDRRPPPGPPSFGASRDLDVSGGWRPSAGSCRSGT